MRRNGVFTRSTSKRGKSHNLNEDLAEPMTMRLATGWERAFRLIPSVILHQYSEPSQETLGDFHRSIVRRARRHNVDSTGLERLSKSLANSEKTFEACHHDLQGMITQLQRDINRNFGPTIAKIMQEAYNHGTVQSGRVASDICFDLICVANL